MGKPQLKGMVPVSNSLVIPLSFQILGKITGLASMCPTLFLLSIRKQLVWLLGKGSTVPHRWFTKLPRTDSPTMKYSVSVFSLSKCDRYSFSCLFFSTLRCWQWLKYIWPIDLKGENLHCLKIINYIQKNRWSQYIGHYYYNMLFLECD